MPSVPEKTAGSKQVQLVSEAGEREAYLSLLLHLEQRARDAASQHELLYIAVNDTRKITGSQQVFLTGVEDGAVKLLAASDITVLDRNAPFVQWIERVVERMAADAGAGETRMFSLPAYCSDDDEELATYPFRHFLWTPLKRRDGTVFAGLLQAREKVWREGDVAPAMRLAGVYQHAWQALKGPGAARPLRLKRRWLLLALAGAVILAGFIPVPLTALAPVEVVAKNPLVVTAPFDGVVDTIVAEPNAPIKQGEEVFRFVDTVLRNKYQAAEQSVEVASARFRRFQQAAIEDSKARHEMAIARAELGLALSERNYAREVLSKAVVTAPADGIVILASKDYWKGRPVSTGEQILQIARPGDVELRIGLAVSDAIVLREGADVSVYLDAAPLSKLTAHLTHASYQAEPSETQTLVYRVRADLTGNSGAALRIGARGAAQIYGDTVPLAFYLFRRPLSAIRQRLGI